jgi:hypothetical protein
MSIYFNASSNIYSIKLKVIKIKINVLKSISMLNCEYVEKFSQKIFL